MNDIQLKKIISNLINKYAKGELKKSFTDYQHTHTHVYYNKDGSIAFLKIRLKDFTTGKKWIRSFRYDNKQKNYTIGEPKFDHGKPLYRLSELIQRDQETIWFCEGETCVETMETFGLLATTSGAAMSYSGSDFSPLANRKVNFFCDFDKAGFNYRENVTRKLQGLGCTVCWVDVDKLPLSEDGDIIDWINAKSNITQEAILNLPLVDAPNLTLESNKKKRSQKENTVASYAFEVSDKGIFYCKNDQLPVWLCTRLEITALTRDPNNENWGRVLEFRDADQQFHQWIMPDAMLKGNGEQLIGELLRLGLNIHPGQKQNKYLLEYISSVDMNERARCVFNIGWYKQAFVLPNKVYGQSEEKLLYQSEIIHYIIMGNQEP